MRVVFFIGVFALLGCGKPDLNRVQPQLVVPFSPFEFGNLPVLNTKSEEIALINAGRAQLTIANVALTKDDGIFKIESKPELIAGGGTENLVITFTPGAEQDYEDTLTFETNDEENPKVELVLTGVGNTRAAIEAQPASLDFGRVAQCTSTVQLVTLVSKGTADLLIEEIAFTEETSSAFSFVGSTRTPATVKNQGADGLPGQIQLTIRVTAAADSSAPLTGGVRIRSTDPTQREIIIPLTATINQAPIARIGMLGNGSPGQRITLDGSTSGDPDGDAPLSYKWTLRSKPLTSQTTIVMPTSATAEMTLDAMISGAYEVQLDVTDATGAQSCMPARSTVVASPAQKLLVKLFWDNASTDLDLHVLRTNTATYFSAPDDCYYQNQAPDWGVPHDSEDNPSLERDALTGFGPEVFGYVNPIGSTYRIAAVFENELLSTKPASRATIQVYLFGVLKAEGTRTLNQKGDVWQAFDVDWLSGDVTVLP